MKNLFLIVQKFNFTNIVWQILTPLLFCLADIITGTIQAWINKQLDSQKMRIGLLHKVLIILIIILSFIIQFAFNLNFISITVCLYVIVMETISIFENLKKAGIDLGGLANILKEKSEKDLNENVNDLVETINKEIK